ncbi:MAG: tetratricopeptide repeat protein [Saprospiraceae bacterium]|nr:tetratricopeptide repeat protein [Saprospiraceae bacterium]
MEDYKTVAAQVKNLIGEADREEALRQLIGFLQSDPKWTVLQKEARSVQAQYLNTKREQGAGRISFEQADINYNRINNQILSLADDLEKGVTRLPAWKRKWPLPVWIALAVVLLGGSYGIFRLSQTPKPTEPLEPQGEENPCAAFSTNKNFKILLWDYLDFLDKQSPYKKGIPVAIQNRLGSIDLGGLTEVRIYPHDPEQSYPSKGDEALKCTEQLVVWGTVEEFPGTRQRLVITRYRFADKWQFAKWSVTENDQWEQNPITATIPLEGNFVDTLTLLSNVFTSGEVSVNIENLLRLAIGLNARQQQQQDEAIAALQDIDTKDSTLAFLGGMLLADTYTRMNKEDEALKAYEGVLAVHPNYGLALNNKAALQIKQGNFGGAIATLDNAVALAPDNVEAVAMRGAAYLSVNQLDKARQDFRTAKAILQAPESLRPDDNNTQKGTALQPEKRTKWLNTKMKELDRKYEVEKTRIREADRQLQRDPVNIQALNTKADASKNVGDYTTAISSAQSVIEKAPGNLKAHATLIESFIAIGDTVRAKETLQNTLRQKIPATELRRTSPLIRSLPDSFIQPQKGN